MDRDFLFGATADHHAGIFDLDAKAKRDGGSRKLSYQEAMDLAAADAKALADRLREHEARPRVQKGATYCGPLHYRWSVFDQHGNVYAEGRAFTDRGARRKAHRAEITVRLELALDGAGSAGWAAEPACQHGAPFSGACDGCGRGAA